MRRFLEYLFLDDDNDDYLFPSPIGHFVAVVLIIVCIATCSHKDDKKDEVKHIDMTIEVDTTQYPAEQVNLDSIGNIVVTKGKYWSAKKNKLPAGIVYQKQFAGEGTNNQSQGDNYVTIKASDGQLIIVRDIDVDLYLNLEKGDTIK